MVLEDFCHDAQHRLLHLDDGGSEFGLDGLDDGLVFETLFALQFEKEVLEQSKEGDLRLDWLVNLDKVDETLEDAFDLLLVQTLCQR